MFFNPKTLLVGACALLFSGVVSAADCWDGPFGNTLYIGGPGGEEWCHTKYDQGIVITGMEVWAAKDSVRAVQFYYSDGTNSGMVGRLDGIREHARIDWDPSKDGISQLKSWGNGRGKYLGRVYLRLKSGGELNVGKDVDGQQTYETDVQSGIMIGASGRVGRKIDGLRVLFLQSKISKMTMEDMKFEDTVEDLNERMQGLQTLSIDYSDHKNNQDNATVEFSFSKRQIRTVTKEYTQTATHAFGITQAIEISGKILGYNTKSTTTLSYEYTDTDTISDTTSDTTALWYTTATEVPPGGRVYCRATAMLGVYKGKYSANVKLWLEDGTDFSFAQSGVLDQVTWSEASSQCQNHPFEDSLPKADAPINVEPYDKRAVEFSA